MKRYCQTLELVGDSQMIESYIEAHRHVWPEVQEGIRSVGILDMQIYRLERRVFMIMDTTDDFDFVVDNARLATLPRQAEWESSRCTVVSCVHILTHDQRKPLRASPLIAAVRLGATMRRRSRLY